MHKIDGDEAQMLADTVQSGGTLMLRQSAVLQKELGGAPPTAQDACRLCNGSAHCNAITEHCVCLLPFLAKVKILFGFLLRK